MVKAFSDRRFRMLSAIFLLLLTICVVLIVYITTPLNPDNISAETVCKKGETYTIKLDGISDYDDNGFMLSTKDFYFIKEKTGVVVGDDGIARTSHDKNAQSFFDGRYSTAYIDYDSYELCSEKYKTKEELEEFFDSPDMIYGFDINDLSYYIRDVIEYEKKFTGTATVKIYRKKAVITEVFIGEEKIMEIKI